LGRQGHRVAIPAVGADGLSGGWPAWVHAVVQGAPAGEHTVLVGHSGAGPLLPPIADQMARPPARLVFVDAGVPPLSGEASLVPDEFLDSLRALAQGGVLPKWSEWFGPGTMETLVPDLDRRAAVVAELPRVPLSYFDGPVPMPTGWSKVGCAYILLSEAYRSDAAEAAARDWPVIELPGGHLDIVMRPGEIADALVEMARC
jgi:hypothetical protein